MTSDRSLWPVYVTGTLITEGHLNAFADGIVASAPTGHAHAAVAHAATHTTGGTDPVTLTAAQLSDLTETVQDIVAALIVAGTNVTTTYDDVAGTFTITSTATGGTGTTDPEIVRDVIGGALVAGSGVQVVVNDAADTITISSTAVLPTRQVASGTGLSGGGDLSADRTLAVTYGTTAGTAAAGDHGHDSAYVARNSSVVAAGTPLDDITTAGRYFTTVAYSEDPLHKTPVALYGHIDVFALAGPNILQEYTTAVSHQRYVRTLRTTGVWSAWTAYALSVHNHGALSITSGTLATARLATGTADGTTFLRGDQTWAVPAGGGGGGGGVNALPRIQVGEWRPTFGTINTGNSATIGTSPIGTPIFLQAGTYDQMNLFVLTAGAATCLIRMGLVDENDAVLIDAGTVGVGTTGTKVVTFPSVLTVTADRWAFAVMVAQGDTTTLPKVKRHESSVVAGAIMGHVGNFGDSLTALPGAGYAWANAQSAALTAPLGARSSPGVNVPIMTIRRSA